MKSHESFGKFQTTHLPDSKNCRQLIRSGQKSQPDMNEVTENKIVISPPGWEATIVGQPADDSHDLPSSVLTAHPTDVIRRRLQAVVAMPPTHEIVIPAYFCPLLFSLFLALAESLFLG